MGAYLSPGMGEEIGTPSSCWPRPREKWSLWHLAPLRPLWLWENLNLAWPLSQFLFCWYKNIAIFTYCMMFLALFYSFSTLSRWPLLSSTILFHIIVFLTITSFINLLTLLISSKWYNVSNLKLMKMTITAYILNLIQQFSKLLNLGLDLVYFYTPRTES